MSLSRREMFGLTLAGGALLGGLAPLRARAEVPAVPAAPTIVPVTEPPQWETRSFIARDGTRIVYRVMGQGRPLVFVHGGASNAYSHYTTAKLIADRFRISMIERRNYGVSGDSRSPISYALEGQDVHRLLSLAGPDAALFGHSAGALVSLCAARDHRNISRTLLYEPPILSAGDRVRPILALFRQRIAAGQIRDAIANTFHDVAGNTIEGGYALADRMIGLGPKALPRMLFILETELKNLAQLDPRPASYRDLARPVTFFTGDQSAAVLQDSVAQLHAALPESRVVTFKGEGHTVNLFRPQILADAITQAMA